MPHNILNELFLSLSSISFHGAAGVKNKFSEDRRAQLAALLWLNKFCAHAIPLPEKVRDVVSRACDNPHVRYAVLGAVVKAGKEL
jgi:hypothetical protein